MAKRQYGVLHDLHIRIKEDDYDRIKYICDQMGISIAEYFNTLLEEDGYDRLYNYARTLKTKPQKVQVIFPDKSTEDCANELTTEVRNLSEQTRRIGVNLSNMIRDIRSGRTSGKECMPWFEKLYRMYEHQLTEQQALGKSVEKFLYTDKGIQKTEYRKGGE